MKGHFGVDGQSKLIHSVEVTPANIHDSHVLPWLLHGQERRVWGDSAYAGQAGVLSVCAPYARDFIHRRTASRATNRWKSRIRVRVEHSIGVIKRVFGFTKVCYRGLAKNRHRLVVASALANLFMVRKRLLRRRRRSVFSDRTHRAEWSNGRSMAANHPCERPAHPPALMIEPLMTYSDVP